MFTHFKLGLSISCDTKCGVWGINYLRVNKLRQFFFLSPLHSLRSWYVDDESLEYDVEDLRSNVDTESLEENTLTHTHISVYISVNHPIIQCPQEWHTGTKSVQFCGGRCRVGRKPLGHISDQSVFHSESDTYVVNYMIFFWTLDRWRVSRVEFFFLVYSFDLLFPTIC